MNAEAAADMAVLIAALLMLVAIVSKLITANLVTRSKRVYTELDANRRDISSRLKEVQLKRTSARGMLEFWHRRRTETSQKVQDLARDLARDLENYTAQGDVEEVELGDVADAATQSDSQTDSQLDIDSNTEGESLTDIDAAENDDDETDSTNVEQST